MRAWTMLLNATRGLVKSMGRRLPVCSAESFPNKARPLLPAGLAQLIGPMVNQVQALNQQIDQLDQQVEGLVQRYPEIRTLRTVPWGGATGGGDLWADAQWSQCRSHSRSAGAFLGLGPRKKQSGDSDPQCKITRAGNTYLRSLLLQSAHYRLGHFGPDSAVRNEPWWLWLVN